MRSGEAKSVAVPTIDIAEFGITDANGVLQRGGKHGLQVAGGATDDPEHLRRGRLLLQRFREVVGAFGEVCGALV